MERFAVLAPGDWPAQFYVHRAVYISCENFEVIQCTDTKEFSCSRQAVVPLLGPLHVALNGKEAVMQNYHNFFKFIYECIFPNSKLADKSKPWRTAFLLEVAYGGWTLIRSKVKTNL